MAELERLRWVAGLGRQQHIMARAWQIKQEAMLAFYQQTLDSLTPGQVQPLAMRYSSAMAV